MFQMAVFQGVVQLATHHLSSMACLYQLLTYALECQVDVFDWHRNLVHVAAHEGNVAALTTIILHIRKHEKAYRYVTALELNPLPRVFDTIYTFGKRTDEVDPSA